MNYTMTHIHSDRSNPTTIIDSVTNFTHYVDRAKELGMKSIAFTEHGNAYSWVKKKEYIEKQGMKFIFGIEMYMTKSLKEKIRDNYHVCLYAKNWSGVQELLKLITKTYDREDGHYYYVPRMTFKEFKGLSDNILWTSSCLGGVIASNDEELKQEFINHMLKNKDRCWLEVQHHQVEEQINYNKYLLNLSKQTGLKLIAGTDTHALDERHAKGRIILQKSKDVHFDNEDSWDITMKTYDELVELYRKQRIFTDEEIFEFLDNTNKLADMIEEFELDRSHKYPKMSDNPVETLKEKVIEGIKEKEVYKYPNYDEYKKRISEELKVYEHNKAIDFLLLDADIKEQARENGIYCGYSRGSVSGSLIAYLIGMTEMDSIKHKLNFQRFMSSERVSLCDVDSDYGSEDREWVKEYLFNKHGLYCSEIVTFNTVALKGAIRDCGRALDIPLETINQITKDIDDENNEIMYRQLYPELFEYVDIVNGTIVSIGTHPAGVVVSPIPLDENMGLVTLPTTQYPVSMINMKEIDGQNFVKLDLLGLDNVKLINETCKLAGIERLTPDNVPDDEKVWKSIRNDTTLIFQWESDSAARYLKELFSDETVKKIKEKNPNFQYIDLFSVGNGAIRPAGASYREELARGIFRDNGHEALNEFLSPTLGYCIEENQKISTTNGLKKIKDITDKDFVYTENGVNKVFHKVYMGEKETIKITTENTDIISTKDHKILTAYGWRKAEDINVGDVVAYRVGNENIERQNANLNKIVGYLLGDGMLTRGNNVGFINKDIDVIKEFRRCIEEEFDELTCSINNRKSRVNELDLYVSYAKYRQEKKATSPLVLWLREVGLKTCNGGLHAREKFIPSYIFNGDRLSMLSMLGAYTDTDSCLKNGERIQLSYKTASKQLSEDLVELGRLLGYKFKVYYDGQADAYHVYACDCKPLLKELYEISIKVRKTFMLDELISTRVIADSKLPRNMIKSIFRVSGISLKKIYNQTGVNLSQRHQYIGAKSVKKINELYPNILPDYLLNDNIKWVIVDKIEENGTKRVYDIEVENEHNFTCQGIIVHNCVYQEQVMEFLNKFCGYTMGESDLVRRSFAKKLGTEEHIPRIKEGFIETMKTKYGVYKEEAEQLIINFLKVIEDASDYLFSLNHSQAYSYIGYVCGYLRYYYPLEFFTTALNINSDNLEKTTKIIECVKEHNITIEPPTYGKSKAKYFFDKETDTIYKGVGSVKYLNDELADKLYQMSQETNYLNFEDLYLSSQGINSRQWEVLIKIGYFRNFGSAKYLLKVIDVLNEYMNKKQFKKDKVDCDLIRMFAKSETDKMFKDVDTLALCLYIISTLKKDEFTIGELARFEAEYIGSVNITNPNVDNRECIVLDVNTKYTPTLTLYRLRNGEIIKVKVAKDFFNDKRVEKFNHIHVSHCTKRQKNKKVDGKWVKTDEFDFYINYYILG